MKKDDRIIMPTSKHVSFQQVFRLIFVIFSLYLMGDVFFRWDGVSYYATFSEFLSSIALISILWSIAATLTAIIIWLSLRAFQWFCQRMGWKINTENLLLFISIIIAIGIIIWVGKRAVFGGGSSILIKSTVLFFAIFATIFFTWIFRGKLCIIEERITPLVWLFGIIVILSIPVVIYDTGDRGKNKLISRESAQSSIAHKNRPNIILVTFDALTARDMSVYGYHRSTTPFISEWSKNATVFTRVEAGGNYTFPNTLSLMTGQRSWTLQQYNPNGRQLLTPDNLPKVLKNNGYYNIAIIQNPLASVNRLGIAADFDIAPGVGEFNRPGSFLGWLNDMTYELAGDKILLYDWITKSDFLLGMLLARISNDVYVTQYPPERIFNGILSLLADKPSEPYFVWAHLNPPHDPYLPPKPYMGLFNSSSDLRTQKRQYKFTRPGEGANIKIGQKTFNTLRARYDEFIRYCDQEFKYLIKQLQKKDMLKDTVIILSADHGESFEHGYLTHGGQELYEQVTNIPLIIKLPGQTGGRIINDLVEQVDISCTILDLADITVPSWMEGRSLKPLMHGKSLPQYPIFSMTLLTNPLKRKKITMGKIAVWDGDYKLIHRIEEDRSLLFNLREDPGESDNLFEREPEVGRPLRALILKNLKEVNEKISKGK